MGVPGLPQGHVVFIRVWYVLPMSGNLSGFGHIERWLFLSCASVVLRCMVWIAVYQKCVRGGKATHAKGRFVIVYTQHVWNASARRSMMVSSWATNMIGSLTNSIKHQIYNGSWLSPTYWGWKQVGQLWRNNNKSDGWFRTISLDTWVCGVPKSSPVCGGRTCTCQTVGDSMFAKSPLNVLIERLCLLVELGVNLFCLLTPVEWMMLPFRHYAVTASCRVAWISPEFIRHHPVFSDIIQNNGNQHNVWVMCVDFENSPNRVWKLIDQGKQTVPVIYIYIYISYFCPVWLLSNKVSQDSL